MLPDITMVDYINRIRTHGRCNEDVLDISALYMLRLSKKIPICVENVHRLTGICLLLASKFEQDDHYSNRYWAKLLGISLLEVNYLERQVLAELEYNLYPFTTGLETLFFLR